MPDQDNLLVTLATPQTPSIIKIIGVGGGGCNAVGHMYKTGMQDVRFLVCNSDRKSLEDSPVPDRLQIGPGLGCGGDPKKGRELAEESIERIREALDKDTKMVFITTGMGGGTGTGASPVIAREAKKKGILTVGIVTTPFLFECKPRIDKALDGVEAIAKEVDALLVINNQRLCDIYSNLSVIDAFAKADDTLTIAAGSIVEIISMHGRVGLDFQDVCTVLRDGGVSIMSTGYGEGEQRVTKAISNALHSPLLNRNDVYDASKIILCLTFSDEEQHTLIMEEMNEINEFMEGFQEDIETKWGMATDRSLGKKVKVTILASGYGLFGKSQRRNSERREEDFSEKGIQRAHMRDNIYGKRRFTKIRPPRPRVHIYNIDDLENERIIALVDNTPTRTRSRAIQTEIQALSDHTESAPSTQTAEPDSNIISFDL